jgi:2-amino-4-hydroxy-6-hydroxymethyldihydropteridine diphosphokinase
MPHEGLFAATLCAAALRALKEHGVRVLASSRLRRTVAWPDPTDPPFWNAAAMVDVGDLSPESVLAILFAVEARFGRVRTTRNAPRTLDLDLLDQGGRIRTGSDPILPHPGLAERVFVLEPLAEIAPDWVHPVLKARASDLLARLERP